MKYYTKEWYRLLMSVGNADIYEPVVDKKYSDEEIAALYDEMMEKYVDEERTLYDLPPFDPDDPEDFDAEEFEAYQNRPPFDEEEARDEFKEIYEDNLEDPDGDLPDWVRETVNTKLLAMYLLPENTYRKLLVEEQALQKELDKLDEEAEEGVTAALEKLPEEFRPAEDDLTFVEGDDVTEVIRGDDLKIVLSGWDDEDKAVRRTMTFENAEIIEDEGLDIKAGVDEDGDIESNCSLEAHELYFEDGRLEVHLMFDNDEELKYMTLRCSGAECIEERI